MRTTINGHSAIALVVIVVLAGCASGPRRGASAGSPRSPALTSQAESRDGAPEVVPPDLDKLPDAEPRLEAARTGGPNKPYEVFGQSYTPERGDPVIVQRGLASWYGRMFHGRRTASGESFDMFAMTAAHKTMPIPSYARVRNPANGREVIVRINDRGPFVAGRIIDLSYAAAHKLGVAGGVSPVEVERITHDAIRTGSWRQSDNATALAAALSVPMAAIKPVVAAEPAAAASPASSASTPAPADASTSAPAAEPAAAVAAASESNAPAAAAPVISAPAGPQRAYTEAARGFWLQLGAFARHEGALSFQRQVEFELDWLAPLLAVFNDRNLHRLQAGPYGTRAEAQTAADRLRSALHLVPVIVERQ